MALPPAGEACAFFLSRLLEEIDRLRETPFPGHHVGPRKWLRFVAGIVDTAQEYLLAAGNTTSPQNAAKLVVEAETLGEASYQLLQQVTGAEASQIPHEVVAPFQRWVNALDIQNTIFFRAEHAPNYELWTFDARKWFSQLPLRAGNQMFFQPVGDVQLKVGSFPAWTIAAAETPKLGPKGGSAEINAERQRKALGSIQTANPYLDPNAIANMTQAMMASVSYARPSARK